MTHVFVVNAPTCSGCGMPVAECECLLACAVCGLPESDCECDTYTPSVVKNSEETQMDEEKPLGCPTLDFSKPAPVAHQQKQQPAPTVRQQYPLVANQGEETPLGQPTWNFAPADDCPDEAELVANDNEERPMANRTWEF